MVHINGFNSYRNATIINLNNNICLCEVNKAVVKQGSNSFTCHGSVNQDHIALTDVINTGTKGYLSFA